MRSDSGAGRVGTTMASAALSTFSESSEMPGGQSSSSRSQSSCSGRAIIIRRRVGCLSALMWTSKLRYDMSAGNSVRFAKRVGARIS